MDHESLIFDDWMDGSTAAGLTTSAALSRTLALPDTITLQTYIPVGATAPDSIAIFMDHSNLGRSWRSKYRADDEDVPLLSASSFTLHTMNVLSAGEPVPTLPSLSHVRFRIVYLGPAVRIKVFAQKRKRNHRQRKTGRGCCAPCAGTCGGASLPGVWDALAGKHGGGA